MGNTACHKIRTLCVVLMMSCTIHTFGQSNPYDLNKPVGWASLEGDKAVTGGEGGETFVCKTEEELKTALKSGNKEPRIIYIQGELKISSLQTYNGVENKTILGLPGSCLYNPNRDKKTSGTIKFTNLCKNIILRNLTIKGAGAYDCNGNDNILFQNCQRIWVDHCDIQDGVDSNFDCNNGSDSISVTWCRFRYLIPPLSGGSETDDHRFCCTWGASDKNADVSGGHLNTTFSCCWWDEGCMERGPRVRFGKVHVVNCYYTNKGNHYNIGYGYLSNIYVERCWFDDSVAVEKDYTSPKKGYAEYNLTITGCHGTVDKQHRVGEIDYFIPQDYYDLEPFDVELVPSVVGNEKNGAGATLNVEIGKGVVYDTSDDPTKINNTQKHDLTTRLYDLSGRQASNNYRGLVINNGKKIIRR